MSAWNRLLACFRIGQNCSDRPAKAVSRSLTCLEIECLEDRTVPSHGSLDPLVVITPGFPITVFSPPTWQLQLAQEINASKGLGCADVSKASFFSSPPSQGCDHFLLLDPGPWASSPGNGFLFPFPVSLSGFQLAEDILYREIVRKLPPPSNEPANRLDILFIGHSFGATLNSMVIRRLQENAGTLNLANRVDHLEVHAVDPVTPRALSGDLYPRKWGIEDKIQAYYQTQYVVNIPQWIWDLAEHGDSATLVL